MDSAFMQRNLKIILKGSWNSLNNSEFISRLTPNIVVDILLNLEQHDDRKAQKFFNWINQRPQYKPSIQSYWTLIHILTKHNNFKAARKILQTFSRRGLSSSPAVLHNLIETYGDIGTNPKIFGMLIHHCLQKGMIQDAVNVFHQMFSYDMEPNILTCNSLLRGFVKANLPAMAWQVFTEMLARGIRPNIRTFHAMINACYKQGDFSSAEELMKQIVRHGIHPELSLYNTLICLYSKKGMHYEALNVQERMLEEGIKPDIVTLNSLLVGFCNEGNMRDAMKIYQGMDGLAPTNITYTILINGFCQANNLPEAFKLHEEMIKKGLKPDLVTYNVLLGKLLEVGKLKETNDLLNEMIQSGLKPNNYTCNTLINGQCKRGNMSDALRLRDKMLQSGLVLDVYTYKALIHGFCKQKKADEAKKVFFEMLEAGFKPNYSVCSWMVDMFCKQNELEAIKLLSELGNRGFAEDSFPYCSIIRCLCKNNRLRCAEKVWNIMLENGLDGDALTYVTVIFGYLKVSDQEKAVKLYEQMTSKNLFLGIKGFKIFLRHMSELHCSHETYFKEMIEMGVIVRKVAEIATR